MDTEAMALKAEAALREQQASLAKEDLSDMVAEHAAKQKVYLLCNHFSRFLFTEMIFSEQKKETGG